MLTGPAGAPAGEKDPALFSREVIARMVTDWHVYDAADPNPDQAVLPLPTTPELIGITYATARQLWPRRGSM